MKRIYFMTVALSLLAAATTASAIEIPMERAKEGMGGYMPNFITVSETPAKPLLKEPEYVGKPLYAALKLGNGDDPIIMVALDDEAPRPRIYIDANNDRDLTNDGSGEWQRYGQANPGQPDRYSNFISVELSVEYKENGETFRLPYYLNLYRFFGSDRSERDQQNLFYYPMTKLKGFLEADGKSAMVVLAESRPTGVFSALLEQPQPRGVAGIMIDYNGDGKIETDSRMPEMLGSGRTVSVTEPFHFNGKSFAVVAISPSGRTMTVEEVDVATDPPVWPELPKVAVGDTPPQFTATDIDGKPCNLADLKGKVVLLDFWATWCGPCLAELPNVTPVWNEFKGKDFEIVGISLDRAQQVTPEKLKEFCEARGMTWRHIYDGKGWQAEIGQMYDVRSIPAMFLLDRSGKIVKTTNQLRGPGVLMAAVKEALEAKTSTDAAPAGGTRTSGLSSQASARTLLADSSPEVRTRLQNVRPLLLNREMRTRSEQKLELGGPAPAFSGQTPEGASVSLADYRGKVVLLDFMGTWCGPCRAELPHLAAAAEKFKDQDLQILSIAHERSGSLWTCAIDPNDPERQAKYAAAREVGMANHKILTSTEVAVPADERTRLLQEGKRNLLVFQKNYNITWPVVLDGPYFDSAIYSDYGVFAYPTLYLLDREGKLVATGGPNLRGAKLIPALEAALEGRPQPGMEARAQ